MEHASTPSRESVFPYTFTSKAWNFNADLFDQSPKCATAASELATDTTSAHTHRNASVEIVAFSTQVNTTMVASRGVKPVAPTNTPPFDLGCPARQGRPRPHVLRDERQLLEKPSDPPLKQLSEQLPPNNQPRSRPQHASSEGHGRSARSKCSKTPKHGKQTSQPIQPGAPPPIQASAHSSKNYPPPSSQFSAKSYNTWPAIPQRERTHAAGLEARAAASSSSGLAAGGRLDKAPQSQLQQRQDPLAIP
ncbi:hypothetical protein MRX96_021995 [Rhipicephalus microplus]